jgi:L-2-hydroxyglutarate oxidase
MRELHRSLSRRAFVRSLQRLVPDVRDGDVAPASAGVRAQALLRDGSLVDDFLIIEGRRSLHVLNAPSPGATSSLVIGETLAARVAAAAGRPVERLGLARVS